jgi:hypothetical protein
MAKANKRSSSGGVRSSSGGVRPHWTVTLLSIAVVVAVVGYAFVDRRADNQVDLKGETTPTTAPPPGSKTPAMK